MNRSSIIPLHKPVRATEKINRMEMFARQQVLQRLKVLKTGKISLIENNHEHQFGDNQQAGLHSIIEVKHPSFWTDVAFGGVIGAGEAYINDSWQTNDLVKLVRILLQNRQLIDAMESRLGQLKVPVRKLLHWLSRNTRKGSLRNIRAHYDLGNELFSLFLDPTMMYSSAYYADKQMSLDEAAVYKLDLICRKLDLTPADHVLEIGTGWGGFAIYAASHYGCKVTTTTISDAQYQLAKKRVQKAGLENQVTLLKSDYRDLQGSFDKLVSIEMIEAIGHQYLPDYFAACNRLLKPHGSMLLQAITITDHRYPKAVKTVDFIKKHIFPGGFLPSITAMSSSIASHTNMKVIHLEDIGHHYARTLADWRDRFMQKQQQVLELGYPQSFIRLWEFYFGYCEGGFSEREIGTVQMLITKPGSSLLPQPL